MASSSSVILNALEYDLIRKPEAPAGVLLREIGSPDGLRRADALWLPAGHGYGLTGYEVKVSHADVLSELASPHKCESWKKYCRYWWLVVSDESIVKDVAIPSDWGVLTPPIRKNRRAFTVIKPAPELAPNELGPALTRLGSVWAYERSRHSTRIYQDQHTLNMLRDTVSNLEHQLRDAGIKKPNHFENESIGRAKDFMEALRKRQCYALPDDIETLADNVTEYLFIDGMRSKVAAALDEKIVQIERALTSVEKSWRIRDLMNRLRDTSKELK